MKLLAMTSACYNEIMTYGYAQLPFESCGVIASSNGDFMDTFIPIINDHPNPLHYFSFQPQSWINAMYQLQLDDLLLIGYMHTHPNEAAVPSSSDIIGFDDQQQQLLCIVSYKQKDSPYIRLYQHLPTKGMKDYPLMLT